MRDLLSLNAKISLIFLISMEIGGGAGLFEHSISAASLEEKRDFCGKNIITGVL
jgi:hypothetical protein